MKNEYGNINYNIDIIQNISYSVKALRDNSVVIGHTGLYVVN